MGRARLNNRSSTARSSLPLSPSTGGRGGCATASEDARHRILAVRTSSVRHIFKGEEQVRDIAKLLRRPSRRRMIVGAASVAALAVVASAAFAIGVKPTGAGAVKTGTNCGDTVSVGPTNKSGIFSTMPKSLQDIYGSYPDKIVASPWATQKIKAKPPWKIGYIAIGISNPYNNDVLAQLKKEFAIAKAKGLVKGSLQVNIPPS